MPIFQDNNGLAVKFFIQKDLPQEVQAELCETITSLGGRVEAKVPRQGYILIQTGTAEEERLRLCWTSADRPERHFVPYSYVEACKVAGKLLKQIFTENGNPIPMHIHPTIANVNAKTALRLRILHSGGDPHASAQSARVILADPNTDVFHHLVKTHQSVADKYIESYLWVKKCIERGAMSYTPLVYKNPGGRRAGEERTQFTDEDEDHLCNWIAAKIPYKEIGGRTGNRLYQQLCELSVDPEYAWVTRHTWQSWRERYKKNSDRLDNIIARIVEQTKPAPGQKGQYGYVRQAESDPKRSKRRKKSKFDQQHYLLPQTDEVLNTNDELHAAQSQVLPVDPSQLSVLHNFLPRVPTLPVLADDGNRYSPMLSSPTYIPVERRSIIRKSPAEEELDDDAEWTVRVGNQSPPLWGKRKAMDDVGLEKNKRLYVQEGPASRSEENTLGAAAVVAIANMHVIDHGIRDIAKAFRFTVEEVQEFYDKCGEMGLTRSRFQKMRGELEAKFSDELK